MPVSCACVSVYVCARVCEGSRCVAQAKGRGDDSCEHNRRRRRTLLSVAAGKDTQETLSSSSRHRH